jgi:3-deoxy-D-manno-octulosonate 8-phosphate phosphatase (KDO 8-P phosphatase)
MIKLIVLDIDGVMTDGKKYYDREGTVRFKTFCDKDWTAIKRFRALGIQVVFLTGDPFNVAIAENRKIDIYVNRQNGVHSDKSNYLSLLCTEYNVTPEEIAFAGDDIFDVHLMQLVGKAYCPSDAPEIVKTNAVILGPGGENFVMRMFDSMVYWGLIKVDNFADHLEKVYELDLQEKF